MPRLLQFLGSFTGLFLLCVSPTHAVTDAEMEPLAAELDGRWAIVRAWWEGAEPPEAVTKLLAPEIESTPLWPTQLEEQFLPGGIMVRTHHRDPSSAYSKGRPAVLKLLALPGAPASRTEFKLIEAREDPESKLITSVALVGIHRFLDSGRSEIRARWQSDWKRQDGELLLVRNTLLEFREVRTEEASPLLADRTSAVLPVDANSDESLTAGNYTWRHRIEASLQPDPFGQTGISIADVNGDRRPDIYLCQLGGLPNRLFIQTPSGRCEDHSESSGLDILDNTTSALFLDFDNDGDQDAALSTAAGLVIYANNGQGNFTRSARFEEIPYGFGMAAADYDRDGDLDLYVCQYYASAQEDDTEIRGAFPIPFPVYDANNGGRNVLLRNDGALSFTDVTAATGLDLKNRRFSYSCLWEDWNRDGDLDLVVVNDFGRITSYRNTKGTFVEDSAARGFDQSGFGMGCVAADFNRDTWTDLYVDNMFSGAGSRITRQPWFRKDQAQRKVHLFQQMAEGNALFLNNMGENFENRSRDAGVQMGRWSWGCAAPDLNNDGWEDLLVANGFVTGIELDDL